MTSFSTVLRSLTLSLIVGLVIIPSLVSAEGGVNTGGGGVNTGGGGVNTGGGGVNTSNTLLVNPLGSIDSLPKLLDAILGAVVQLGAIFLVHMLVFVGFKFVMAQGNEEELRSARTALMWTIIGGLLLLGAQAISLVIQDTIKGLQ